MVLPVSGPLTLNQIAGEFVETYTDGDAHTLNQFYSGGIYVPVGTTNGMGDIIPATGPLTINMFYGAASGFVWNIMAETSPVIRVWVTWTLIPNVLDYVFRFRKKVASGAPNPWSLAAANLNRDTDPTTLDLTISSLNLSIGDIVEAQATYFDPSLQPWSPIKEVTIAAPPVPTPSNLRIDQIAQTTARARWDAPTVAAGLTFVRYEAAIASSGQSFATDTEYTSNSISFTGLVANTGYRVRVLAVFRNSANVLVKSAYVNTTFTTLSEPTEDCTEWTANGSPTTEYGEWSDWSDWAPSPCVAGDTQTRTRQRSVTRVISETRTCDGDDVQTRTRRERQTPELGTDTQTRPCPDEPTCFSECSAWTTTRTENEVTTVDLPPVEGEWTPSSCPISGSQTRTDTFTRIVTTRRYLHQTRTCGPNAPSNCPRTQRIPDGSAPTVVTTTESLPPKTRACCYIGPWGTAYIASRTLTPWQNVGSVTWGEWSECIPEGEPTDEPGSNLGTRHRSGTVSQEATQVTVWRQDRQITSACPSGTATFRTSTVTLTANDPGGGFLRRTATVSEDEVCFI